MTTTTPRRAAHSGPPLPPIAIASVTLFMTSLVLPALLTGHTYPSPHGPAAAVLDYFSEHPAPVLVMSLLQFAASVPLGIYAPVVSVRLNRLGVRAPGPTIGLVGGVLAATSMALSAMFTWTLTLPEILAHPELIRLMHDLAFISGGPGFVVPLGLLVAGIAVPGLLAALLPRALAWTGLVIAALAMISTLTWVWPDLSILLPMVRFPAFVWIIAAAFLLPHQRNPANHATTGVRS